jgi:hypothetical protein
LPQHSGNGKSGNRYGPPIAPIDASLIRMATAIGGRAMSEAAAASGADRSRLEALVAKHAGDSADVQAALCEKIESAYGAEAKAMALELFAAQRAKTKAAKAERPRIMTPAPAPEADPEPPEPEPRVQLPAVVETKPTPTLYDAVIALNAVHAIIDNVGGKTVIASWEPSPLDPSKLVVVYHNKSDFLLRYENRKVSFEVPDGQGGTRIVDMRLGQWWLRHSGRRQYRGVTFVPNGPEVINGCLNLWRGWGVEPGAGDWSLIRDHIETVVAAGNAVFAEYVIRWIAWAIQNPDKQAEVALVLIGDKGAGKGTMARVLQRVFGAHAFQASSPDEVAGRFNGHLQDCILFVADEAYWGDKHKACVGRLQGMITEPTLSIEPKGIGIFQVRNLLHIMMLAEPGWVIPAGRHERRYAALEVSNCRRGDRSYFKALHQQIENGGAEALFHDLEAMDLGDWHPRELPDELLRGSALQKQQGHTLPALEQWYMMLLHDGMLPGALSARPNTTYTRSLIDDAKKKFPRLRFDLSEVALRNFLLDATRIGVTCEKYRASIGNGWSFPPLLECRAAMEAIYGPTKWDNANADEWMERSAPPTKPAAPTPVLKIVPASPSAPAARPASFRRL